MGLNETMAGGNVQFLSLAAGKIVKRANEPFEGSKERTNKNGRVVHERMFGSIDGYITGIKWRESEIENKKVETMEVSVVDASGEKYQLSMKSDSGYARSMMNVLLGVKDFSKVLRVFPYEIKDEKFAFPMTGISVYLKPNDLTSKVKKVHMTEKEYVERHGGVPQAGDVFLPAPNPVTFKGETVNDYGEQVAFLKEQINLIVLPRIAEAASVVRLNTSLAASGSNFSEDAKDVAVPPSTMDRPTPMNNPDDLPFGDD